MYRMSRITVWNTLTTLATALSWSWLSYNQTTDAIQPRIIDQDSDWMGTCYINASGQDRLFLFVLKPRATATAGDDAETPQINIKIKLHGNCFPSLYTFRQLSWKSVKVCIAISCYKSLTTVSACNSLWVAVENYKMIIWCEDSTFLAVGDHERLKMFNIVTLLWYHYMDNNCVSQGKHYWWNVDGLDGTVEYLIMKGNQV